MTTIKNADLKTCPNCDNKSNMHFDYSKWNDKEYWNNLAKAESMKCCLQALLKELF